MNRDTFWTISYRGHFIHGCYDHSLGREILTTSLTNGRQFVSLRGAKVAISRIVNRGVSCPT